MECRKVNLIEVGKERKVKPKPISVTVSEALDHIAVPELALLDAVFRATPDAVLDELCPEYFSTEESLTKIIGTIAFECENQELHDLIYRYIDLRSLLVWRLAGPMFLRLAGLSDEQIARTCSLLAFGTRPDGRNQIVD